jgi:hypothetical protein
MDEKAGCRDLVEENRELDWIVFPWMRELELASAIGDGNRELG